MDTEAVVHTHNGVLLSFKKECIWVSTNEVDEPRVYFTEWSNSERERQILYINTCMKSRKMVLMNLFAGQQWKHKYREQTCGHGVGGTGWEELREKHGNIYITICKTDRQWEFALWHKELNPVLCDNLERWDGVEDGKEVQEGGGKCITVADSCWCVAETSTNL